MGKAREEVGIWLSQETFQAVSVTPGITSSIWQRIWWWLTPALWPVDEADFKSLIEQLLQKGSRQFVLNAPWQIAFFQNPRKLSLWAGPFCNLSNPLSINEIKSYGFSGAIVSPELGQDGLPFSSRTEPPAPGDCAFRELATQYFPDSLGSPETRYPVSEPEGRNGMGELIGFQLLGLSQLDAQFDGLPQGTGTGRLPAIRSSDGTRPAVHPDERQARKLELEDIAAMNHSFFMEEALAEARQALERGEFPVGCVIVHEGKIIATGSRQGTAGDLVSETDHAEILALKQLERSCDRSIAAN